MSTQFMCIKINRTADGISLYIQSSKIEEFIKQVTHRPDLVNSSKLTDYQRSPAWSGVRGYQPSDHHMFRNRALWGGELFIQEKLNTYNTGTWYQDYTGYTGGATNIPVDDTKNKKKVNFGRANLAFLFAKGLSNGVTFNLKGIYTEEQIKQFLEEFKIASVNLYKEFMRPFAKEVVLSYEEL